MLLERLAEELDRQLRLHVLVARDQIVLERELLRVRRLERGVLDLLLGRLQLELVARLTELLLGRRDGLRDREILLGAGGLQLGPQLLDLRLLLRGGLLRLLRGIRDGEGDLGLLDLLGLGQTRVDLGLELDGSHLLRDVGVLRLIDGEDGPAVRALDLMGCTVRRDVVHVAIMCACADQLGFAPDKSPYQLHRPLTPSPRYCESMPTTAPLLLDLTGVARLAGVRRAVPSMWRKRFVATSDPFPQAVAERAGRPVFDAAQVAEWLSRTEHGNNPEARADAAAEAVPPGFAFTDEPAVAELEALIALYAHRGTLDDLTSEDLLHAAIEADPSDGSLRTELAAHAGRGAPWLDYAERLIDAAYSPAAALELVGRRRAASLSTTGSAGPLTADAIALVVAATQALIADATADVTVTLDAHDVELALAVATAVGDETDLALPTDADARRARRRLVAAGHFLVDAKDATSSRAVVVARVPAAGTDDIATVLRAIDEVALSLREHDAAIVIGPSRALVDSLHPADELLRDDALRSGRVRGIARLTTGLVETAPRESLALWVLGAPMGEVAIADRFTVVADLIDAPLTPATRADLVSDLVASMGGRREVLAHAFRFAQFVQTRNLLARAGSLVVAKTATRQVQSNPADLPVLIDAAADAVAADLAPFAIGARAPSPPPAPTSVADLVRDGHLRVISGTRLTSDLHGSEGLVVVSASDLDDPAVIGDIRVDQFAFAKEHPSAGLTRPGDVIFRTGPTAAAWVDVDGSKVVAYPARVLRITAADPGGLIPELVATDIVGQPAGPGAWKRWMLRRVAPQAAAPLRGALADIAAQSEALRNRAARLDRYAELLAAGVVAGAVTLEPEPRPNESTDTTAAVAASTQ
ncbi:hypothetical protein [Agromyces sp. NPDC055658]